MARALLAFTLVAACAADTSTGIVASDVTCPTSSTLTYDNFGAAFVTDHCLSCHDTQRPTLTTQAQVKASASEIIDVAVLSSRMPEDGSLSTDERRLLGEWLACGAP